MCRPWKCEILKPIYQNQYALLDSAGSKFIIRCSVIIIELYGPCVISGTMSTMSVNIRIALYVCSRVTARSNFKSIESTPVPPIQPSLISLRGGGKFNGWDQLRFHGREEASWVSLRGRCVAASACRNGLPLISILDNKQIRMKYGGGRRDIRVGRREKKAPTASTLRGLLAPEL